MRISRFIRDMACLILGVLAAAMGIFMVCQHFMTNGFEESFKKEMATMHKVVEDILHHTKTRLYQEAILLSDSRELEAAFQKKDHSTMAKFAKNAMDNCKASFATIVDAQGTVLARGHSDKYGDNIANSTVMKSALNGNGKADLVLFKNNGLSVGAAAPITINGELVGAIMFGEAFKENVFVDEVKRVTGLEMSIFDKDRRIATTIIRDGKRAIHTLLNNPIIAETVLQSGGTYSANADILGRAYKTEYWPLQDSTGTILGMWFIGTEVEGIQKTITRIALSCLFATLAIAAALSTLGIMFFRSLINPLRKKAYIDKLTGITNRAGFDKKISRLFETGTAERPGGLFLIDLDNFKALNDTLGHPVGDECLKRVGAVLKDVFRETDIVARLGGDEFVIYAPTLDEADVIMRKLDFLLKRIAKSFTSEDGKSVTVTASIGVATSHDGKAYYQDMYAIADTALYQSKEGGRNRFTILCCIDQKENQKENTKTSSK